MKTEMEKMIAGENYPPGDPELVAARARAQELMAAYNATTLAMPTNAHRYSTNSRRPGKAAPSARPSISTMA